MKLHFDWSCSSPEVESAIDENVKTLTEPNSDYGGGMITVENTDPSSLRDMARALEDAANDLEQDGY